MKAPAPGIDVVVVNFCTPDDLDGFLGSLVEHAPAVPFDVWVVNVCPGSTDYEVAGRWMKDRHWSALVFEDNVGYNVAANHAGALGSRETVAIFNTDVVLSAGSLDVVHRELHAHEDWGIAGPRQVNSQGLITAAGIFGSHAEPRHRGWHDDGSTGCYDDVRGDCVTVAGSAFFVKRSAWNQLRDCSVQQEVFPGALGALGETFHFWGETSTCYHAAAHGFRCGYVGTSTVVHKHRGASKHGNKGDLLLNEDQASFRRFCEAHGLQHD